MANKMLNSVKIETDVPVELWTVEGVNGERILSFEKIVPLPEETDDSKKYDWRCSNWDTAYDVAEMTPNGRYEGPDVTEANENSDCFYVCEFYTNWGTPDEFYERFAKFLLEKDELSVITVDYEDVCTDTKGRMEFSKGIGKPLMIICM